MIRLWPWRRASEPTQLVQPSPHFGDFDFDSLCDPYSTVSVYDAAAVQGHRGRLVALRNFADRDDATRAHAAWQRHAPELTVQLHHGARTSPEPSYEGFYLDAGGASHPGQPAEIDALIAEGIAAEQARAAERAREAEQLRKRLAAREAEREARRPKNVVVAKAGDDSPFAHHDKFIDATQTHVMGRPEGKVRFRFTEFTGDEPKPVSTAPGYIPDATERQRAQQRLIEAEYDAATTLWAKASYRRKAEWVLRDAADAWPKVADAFARIEQAWSDLDHPPHGWEVAVKQLLDAHDAAKTIVGNWEYLSEGKLATIGAELGTYCGGLAELREQVAGELGIDGVADWQIGHGVDHRGDGRYIDVEDGARDRLDSLITRHRTRLAEITTAAGRVTR
ncbi:hypothetical protein [Amycolatopsis sp. NPDC051903]|uniref:hypothetical protein n=1 Tax=Amycolatopsis sp. NPDC051903 TaxID=3363936 RepID=UPI0037B214EC